MGLFPANKPLESIAVDLLGPLMKTKADSRCIVVIADRFTKLTKIMPLKCINDPGIPKEFASHWVFNYGAPKKSFPMKVRSFPVSSTRTHAVS